MGSWSVHCGISNIAITAGNRCVLLPIKENTRSEMGGYIPACLPILGEYDDYGGIENIERDDNVEFLENHFGVSIEELAVFFVDGKFTYNRDEAKAVTKKLTEKGTFDEIKNWRFMWIDRDVYDFMVTNMDDWHKGHMDYGTPEMLKLFGFELEAESNTFPNYDPKRFNKKFTNGKVSLYSDGRTLLSTKGKGTYIYHFGKGDETSIETYFDVPEELQYLRNSSKHEAWRVLSKKNAKRELGYILGIDHFSSIFDDFEEVYIDLGIDVEKTAIGEKLKKTSKKIEAKYFDNLEAFGDRIAGLVNIRINLHPMSGSFHPFQLYLTPQCGEYEHHQRILEKFTEINKKHIYNEEEED